MSEQNESSIRPRSRVGTALRILNVRLRFVLLMVVTGVLAAKWDVITARFERMFQGAEPTATAVNTAVEYYCPMHPSVIRPDQGSCPICGMPLSKRAKGEAEQLPEGVIGRVRLSSERMRLAGVATSTVDYQPMTAELRAAGTIEIDERRVERVPARLSGRIERLHVTFTGQVVARGQSLAEIYSPDLITTQQELLSALRRYEVLEQKGAEEGQSDPQADATLANARTVLDATRTRLHLWGIDDEQIATMERDRTPSNTVTLRSPVSGTVIEKPVQVGAYVEEGANLYTIADLNQVWMTAYVPESAAKSLEVGQEVEIESASLPDERFRGTLRFIWPVLDAATRSIRVRADVANPQQLLKPGMYVDVTIRPAPDEAQANAAAPQYMCPMHPEVVSSNAEDRCPKCGMFLEKMEPVPVGTKLAIPESAVIQTGTRSVVYLEREPEMFDAVAVELGMLIDGLYEVRSGLNAGDRIVTSGAFLVDAEVRLNPAAAGTYFGATGGPGERATSGTGSSGSDGQRH